jgi:hypothetical protein
MDGSCTFPEGHLHPLGKTCPKSPRKEGGIPAGCGVRCGLQGSRVEGVFSPFSRKQNHHLCALSKPNSWNLGFAKSGPRLDENGTTARSVSHHGGHGTLRGVEMLARWPLAGGWSWSAAEKSG